MPIWALSLILMSIAMVICLCFCWVRSFDSKKGDPVPHPEALAMGEQKEEQREAYINSIIVLLSTVLFHIGSAFYLGFLVLISVFMWGAESGEMFWANRVFYWVTT